MSAHIKMIHGEKGGKRKQPTAYVPKEAPNTLQSRNTARIIDLISEGEIEGLVNGAQSIYLDDTPLQNSDGSNNFAGIHFEERTGTPNQKHIPGIPAVEHEVAVGTEIKHNTPVVRTITNADADAVRVKIRLPALTAQASNGDLNGTSVELYIDVKSANTDHFVSVKRCVISGKTTSNYERSYRVELPATVGPWEIRVRRITPDSQKVKVRNQTYFASYTVLTDAKLIYPDSALIGLVLNAEEFGSKIPKRSYDVKGIRIKLPTNYNPETREYKGLWNGTFRLAWSNNPAWILYDLLTNERYGLGDKILSDAIDKWGLYAIAQYCDELVSDGYGGTEPRFTLNVVINSQKDAYEVVNVVASAFRGMIYWSSGAIVAVQDKPADPVKLVNASNVINGEFHYSGTSLKARHSVALVTWNDPKDGYKSAIEVVEDTEQIKKYGWNQTDVAAFGCTSRGQAHRLGRWLLDSEKNETETVTYKASFDHADVRPGDIIAVADSSYAGVRFGGRIASVVDTRVTLDHAIKLKRSEHYQLSVVLPSGEIETREVENNSEIESAVITINEAFTDTPQPAAMWVLTASDVKPRLFRVVSVSESDKHIFEITALLHDPKKFERVEQGIYLEEDSYQDIINGPLPAVSGVSIYEYLYRSGAAVLAAATLSWEPSTDPRVKLYDVQIKKPDDIDYSNLATTSAPTVDIQNTTEGEYSFRVRAIDLFGLAGPWVTITSSLLALSAPPSDVEGFAIRVTGSNTQLTWDAVPDLDLSHYHIKFTPAHEGASWNDGVDLAVNATGTTLSVPAMVGTYMIKAIDFRGIESINEALINSSITSIEGFNVVENIVESPLFLGDKNECVITQNKLQSGAKDNLSDWRSLAEISSLTYGHNGVVPESIYTISKTLDLGDIYTSRVTAKLRAQGAKITSVMASWLTLAQLSNNLLESTTSDWGVRMQIRTTKDDPAANVWGNWQDFVVGDYTARAYQWRILLLSHNPAVAAQIRQLEITVDMPDRVIGKADLTCPTEGAFIEFKPAFWARPAIAIDAQELKPGDTKRVTQQSKTGFFIQFLDSKGQPVSRSFDYLAKGYGYSN
ncbi:host specificity protein J [Zooshikella sp. RANM57]|uniref:host specificity protein J n=1 Tax=Zooshikella sp. RANM57 TaxID=3425863 RepID=UPI003D6F4BE8